MTPLPWQAAAQLLPTAHALVAEIALILDRLSPPLPTIGLATLDHLVPFQCRISMRPAISPDKRSWQSFAQEEPTAQAFLADTLVTPFRTSMPPGPVPGSGLATLDHLVPFQCRISV